ncbi:MAG: PaaI family thioesterase [Burkholderiales bacterium]
MSQITTGFGIYIPFAEVLGVRKVHEAPGNVRIALRLRNEHMNSWQVAHGGIVMGLLDIAMGMSARSLDSKSDGATTIELKTNFLAAATGQVTAEGFAQRAGRSLVYAEGALTDGEGKVLAKASGTFKLRFPATERSEQD